MEHGAPEAENQGKFFPLQATTGTIKETENVDSRFEWLYIPPEESMYAYSMLGAAMCDKHVHLKLRMLNPPKAVRKLEHLRPILNLSVTKRRVIGLKDFEEIEDPDRFVVDPKNGLIFESQNYYWAKQESKNIHCMNLTIHRFRIQGAQIMWEYLVEGTLQIEGYDQMFKLPRFSISYDPWKAFPEVHGIDRWGRHS